MPNGLLAPEHRIPQVAVKVTTCIDCGDPVEYQFNVPLRCPDCRRDLKRASDRDAGWRRARARDAHLIGETFSCERCGRPTVRSSGCKKVCDECRPARDAEYQRARYSRNIGDTDACGTCGADFVVDHSTRFLCQKCRRKPKPPKCVVCGRSFTRTSNRQKYCADHRQVRVKNEKKRGYEKEKSNPRRRHQRTQYAIRYTRERYRSDPRYAMDQRISSAIYQALGSRKSGRKWESLVGYTLDQLMHHLQRTFLKGMSWDNRSEWDIDHILPLSSFNYSNPEDPAFKAAWALTNLRCLWKSDNRSKNAKRIYLL